MKSFASARAGFSQQILGPRAPRHWLYKLGPGPDRFRKGLLRAPAPGDKRQSEFLAKPKGKQGRLTPIEKIGPRAKAISPRPDQGPNPPQINPYPWLPLAIQISSRAPKLSQRLAQGAGQRQQAQNRACWRKCCAISRHIVKQYSLLSDFPKSKESDKNGNFQPPPRKAPKTEKRPPSNSKPAKPLEIPLSSCAANLKKKFAEISHFFQKIPKT